MQVARAVLLMPFKKPLPHLWPLVLPQLATASNVQLVHYPHRTILKANSQIPGLSQAAGQLIVHFKTDRATAAIHMLSVIATTLMSEMASDGSTVSLMPQDDAFLYTVSALLVDGIEAMRTHRLAGVLVILTTCLVQLFGDVLWHSDEDANMKSAILAGAYHGTPVKFPAPTLGLYDCCCCFPTDTQQIRLDVMLVCSSV